MNKALPKVAVIGAGLMGHGLATVFAAGGHSVVLHDVSAQALTSAITLIQSAIAMLAEAGFVRTKERNAIAARIATTTDLKRAVADADFILEAVTEDANIKRDLFIKLDLLAKRSAIFASNTSFLNIFPLIPERRRLRALITHWYSPPYIIDLVDVVPGPRTRPEVVTDVVSMLTALQKKPLVLKKFVPGFIANRLQAALNLEVYRLLDRGDATPEQIDAAVQTGLALRMPLLGHLKKADYAGLKLVQQTLASRTYRPPKVTGGSRVLNRQVRLGHTGVMAGRGFYDYKGRSPQELFRERDRKLLALKKFLIELGELK